VLILDLLHVDFVGIVSKLLCSLCLLVSLSRHGIFIVEKAANIESLTEI